MTPKTRTKTFHMVRDGAITIIFVKSENNFNLKSLVLRGTSDVFQIMGNKRKAP